jgi:prepilin-type N-terminal cleavage/methylation domain-containing protein
MILLSKSRGFTLIESLVAITVLIVGVLGPLTIAARGISDGLYARNQIAANYLAQEAMEFVINLRDGNLKIPAYGIHWLEGIAGPCLGQTNCRLNLDDGTLEPGNPAELTYCSANGLYMEGCGEEPEGPIFTRSIQVEEVVPDEEVKITVTVTWKNRPAAADQFITVTEHLYARN